MSLSPVPGNPGVFHDTDTGRLLNFRHFSKFETSERMEGVGWHSETAEPFKSSHAAVIYGWRLTCAKWPDPTQPFRMLRDRDLSAEKLPYVVFKQDMLVAVVLTERPVEGAGLRLHLRGLGQSKLPV
jgi:hypothetical protein